MPNVYRTYKGIFRMSFKALSVSLSFNQTTRTFWNLIAYAAFVFPCNDIDTINNGGLSDNA